MRWNGLLLAIFAIAIGFSTQGAALAQTDDICDSVPALTSGDSVERTITDRDYIFAFCFDGVVGEDYTIEVDVLSGDLNAFLAVFPESEDDEDPVAELDPLNERITPDSVTFGVPANGTFIIGIARIGLEDGNTTGTFTLAFAAGGSASSGNSGAGTVVATGGECPAASQPIESGQTVDGTITDESYFTSYCFSGQAGDSVSISAEAASGNLDTLLLLTDPNVAKNFGENDDCDGSTTNSCLEVELPQAGTYVIAVGRFGSENGSSSGDYTLTFESDGAGVPAVGGAKDPAPGTGGSTAVGDCNADPLATLVAGLWEFNLEDDGFRATFEFDCTGGVVVEIEEITGNSTSTTTTATTYTLDDDGDESYTLEIVLADADNLVFTNTIVAETGIIGLLDGESLIILLNVR